MYATPGCSPPSEPYPFATLSSRPDAPTSLAPSSRSNTSLGFSWAAPLPNGEAVTQINVSLCVAATSTCVPLPPLPGGATNTTVANLPPATNYTLSLRAYNSLGWSPPSAALAVLTADAPQPPDEPTLGAALPGLPQSRWLRVLWSN